MSDQPIRILIADDHPVFRFGLRALLESQADMVVLAEVESGEDSVQMVHSVAPRISNGRSNILLALAETDGNRAEAARRLGVSRSTLYRRMEKLGILGKMISS